MARRIRVRVAFMGGIHNVMRQVPGPPARPGLGDGQLGNRCVASMVAPLGAHHQRHHVATGDRCLQALPGGGVVRDGLRAAGADRAMREHRSAGSGVNHDGPFDPVAAVRIAHSHVGPDAHAPLQRAAPANGHVAVRRGVHRDTPGRNPQVARHTRLTLRVGAEPRQIARGPTPHQRHARECIYLRG